MDAVGNIPLIVTFKDGHVEGRNQPQRLFRK